MTTARVDRKIAIGTSVVFALALSACGGGGGVNSTPVPVPPTADWPPPPPPPPPAPPAIVPPSPPPPVVVTPPPPASCCDSVAYCSRAPAISSARRCAPAPSASRGRSSTVSSASAARCGRPPAIDEFHNNRISPVRWAELSPCDHCLSGGRYWARRNRWCDRFRH